MDSKCEAHSGLITDIGINKKNIDKLFTAVDILKNRPPVWTTLLLTLMGLVIGSTLTYASLAVKIAEMTKVAVE